MCDIFLKIQMALASKEALAKQRPEFGIGKSLLTQKLQSEYSGLPPLHLLIPQVCCLFQDKYLGLISENTLETTRNASIYTMGHSLRAAVYVSLIAEGANEDVINCLKLAALSHDLGKTEPNLRGVFDYTKVYTPEDKELMKRHPIYSAEMMLKAGIPFPLVKTVLFHHERYHGNGYPIGLKGEEVPASASFLSVVDAYDSGANGRPYNGHIPQTVEDLQGDIRNKLTSDKPTFDPGLLANYDLLCQLTPSRVISALNENSLTMALVLESLHLAGKPIFVLILPWVNEVTAKIKEGTFA